MSQQINLILEDLRPKFNPLALPVVLLASAMALAGMLVHTYILHVEVTELSARKAALDAQKNTLQQQTQTLGKALEARRGNPELEAAIETQKQALQQREEALRLVESGTAGSTTGFSHLLRGLGRQVTEGVWLTSFSAEGNVLEIHGCLTDASRLPAYIRKLNGEPVFQGRRFAALNMQQSAQTSGEAANRTTNSTANSAAGCRLPTPPTVPPTAFQLLGRLPEQGELAPAPENFLPTANPATLVPSNPVGAAIMNQAQDLLIGGKEPRK